MTLVYLIAMKGPGAWATDWTNDNLFGDGFHLLGIGSSEYNEIAEEYAGAQQIIDGYDAYVEENGSAPDGEFTYSVEDEETLETTDETATIEDYNEALATVERIGDEPTLRTTAFSFRVSPLSLKADSTRSARLTG